MFGTLKTLFGGLTKIATKGKGISTGAKVGMGVFGAGYAAKKVASSDLWSQYEMSRYGKKYLESRGALGTTRGVVRAAGTAGMAGGIGIGVGGGRITAKATKSIWSKTSGLPSKAWKGATTWQPARPSSPLPRTARRGSAAPTSSMAAMRSAYGHIMDRPVRYGLATGGAIGTGAGIATLKRTNVMREGRITAIGRAPLGGISPSMQFGAAQSRFVNNRLSSRIR